MRTFLAIAFALLLCRSAHAAVFLVPDVGYEYGKLSETYAHPAAPTVLNDSSGGGLTFGLKAGYSIAIVGLGVQYETGRMGNAKPSDFGLFAEVKVPLLLHAWASYLVKSSQINGEGSGYELGVGIPFFVLLDLNAVFASRSYNSYSGNVQPPSTTYSATLKTGKITLGVPLDF